MSKLLAFGASSSKKSINKKFAAFVAGKIATEFELLDLNDYEVPIFSSDRESATGIPEAIKNFNSKIIAFDKLVISIAEHNGSYTAVFKNIFDWSSRENSEIFKNKKLFLLSTSPGGRGGSSALEAASKRFPFHGATIVETFSLPSFYENFDESLGIKNIELKKVLDQKIDNFKKV